jgi:hypothetical protein
MPIRPFLAGQAFDPETIKLMSNASLREFVQKLA